METLEQRNGDMEKVTKLISDIRIGMLTTQDEHGNLVSRPMAVMQVDEEGNLWFLTKEHSPKTEQIDQHYKVNVAFADASDSSFVSVSGSAEELQDRAKIEELWSPMAKPWFPEGKDDPQLSLLKVHIETAEYWDSSSSRMVRLFEMARAALTGDTYKLGENKLVENH
ncbi:pyridoxamine 5'-phosphate oxidase family protein [Larkinella rosea]|uniref:Pyridoxamine 5'-phosphate oxidase n=1 Tax=Larkinella rosea TaxID=2025312 RepID=A0A3P1BI62_9BACT|nr:pyridoxamine 5'-phosphate oxidase family protein [Larkinella rosea]RRB00777.1 pyridoxamine 5'-phosphate oxidase [Larkinella rosea]